MQQYFPICFSIKEKYADIRNRSDVVGHGIMMKNHVKAMVEIYKKTPHQLSYSESTILQLVGKLRYGYN